MNEGRPVRLFRNGRNQAVRIPRDFELPGDEAVMRKEGKRLIIEPKEESGDPLLEFIDSLEPLGEELPEIEDYPPDPVQL